MATFSSLPTEVRDQIWELSVISDPEIYFFDLCDFGLEQDSSMEPDDWPAHSRKEGPTTFDGEVTMAFPVIMHVCRDSRARALRVMKFIENEIDNDVPPILPCRAFQPNIDAFYIPSNQMDWFIAQILCNGRYNAFLETIEHIALPSIFFEDECEWDTFKYHLSTFTALRTISVVFNSNKNEIKGPVGHFQLEPYKRRMGCLVQNRRMTEVNVDGMFDSLVDELELMGLGEEDTTESGGDGEFHIKFEAKVLTRPKPYVLRGFTQTKD